jgi:queuine/archaeosine tRNA-ribosyltransferase
MLAAHLVTVHNLYFMNDLMRRVREAVARGTLDVLKGEWT